MTIIPEGEALRRALAWIAENRQSEPRRSTLQLVDEAALRFDLTPNEEEWLLHTLTRKAPPSTQE
jgi:hypothetical protein